MTTHSTLVPAVPNFAPTLPYGVPDLDPAVQRDPATGRVRCYVRGCRRWLLPPTRYASGDACPDHGIYCHTSATYSYRDVGRNVLVSPRLLTDGIVGHPFKFESGRFGAERGEDALSYNVFRSFQEARALHLVARLFTGTEVVEEPRLYLWGIDLTGDRLDPWDLLVAARERFERRLPVKRPLTEPDIALYQPGEYLVLCEAKFGSPNPVYARGPRKDAQSLTLDELTAIYDDPALDVFDRDGVAAAGQVAYQLYRNLVFAEYMAKLDGPTTAAYLVNLTRLGAENGSFEGFYRLVRPGHRNRVRHLFWEHLYPLAGLAGGRLGPLRRYLLAKTEHLRPAFALGYI